VVRRDAVGRGLKEGVVWRKAVLEGGRGLEGECY
jgi:hypothetical protein